MGRVLIGIAALLVVAASDLDVEVGASGAGPGLREGVPAYLKPVPMDAANQGIPLAIIIDVPLNHSIYPPDIIPPQFAWRDEHSAAAVWRIDVVFGGEKAQTIQAWSAGEKMQIGPLDETLQGYVPPTLTPEQAADHTWSPDAKTWEEIKKRSVAVPATVIISGYASRGAADPVSRAETTISTAKEPVGAPIFYRDVPLIPPNPETEQRGVIKRDDAHPEGDRT